MIWECLSPDILLRRLLFRLPGTDRRIRIVNGLFFSGLPSLLFFRNKRTFVTVTIWYLQYNWGRVFCKQLWNSQLKLNPRKHVRLRGSIIFYKKRMEAMGLEPMTSRVWGERSSQLSYASMCIIITLCGGKSILVFPWVSAELFPQTNLLRFVIHNFQKMAKI